MSSPKPGTVPVVDDAAARLGLEPSLQDAVARLVRDVDRLHAAYPAHRQGLADWLRDMSAQRLFVGPGDGLGEAVRGVCEWFVGAGSFHKERTEQLVSVSEAITTFRAAQGRRKGALKFALGRVQGPAARAEIEAQLAELEMPEREPNAPRTTPIDRLFSDTLMSLLLACGYGRAGHEFTIEKAAKHTARIAEFYGFTFNVDSLRTNATKRKKS